MKQLNIAILSKIDSPTVTKEFVPELKSRGHNVTVFDMSVIPLDNFLNNPLIQGLLTMDIVYYRSGLSPDLASILEQYLLNLNKKLINLQFSKHPYIHTKSYETIIARTHGFVVPKTLYIPNSTYEEVRSYLGETFVAKPNGGARGENVKLIKNLSEWENLQTTDTSNHLYQSFIPHDFEYRVHLLGSKAVAMYKRLPPTDDFRSNVSQGGKMDKVEEYARPILSDLAVKTAKIFHFEIMAVDFMFNRDTNEYVFTEVNLNPGWEISDKITTDVDLSLVTAEYFEAICT